MCSVTNIASDSSYAVLSNGLVNVFSALALLLAPAWFYRTIGDFPPFNQHYMGDAGAFLLALGLGLLIAARDPVRHRGLIGIGVIGGLLHVGNHVYDDFIAGHGTPTHFLIDTLPLLLLSVWLAWAYWSIRQRQQPRRALTAKIGDV